jgi:hypothetical protein
VLKERDIQRTVCDFLRAERWRVFEIEHEFSERKRKTFGESGMPDILAIRYRPLIEPPRVVRLSEVLWVELKRIDKRGRATKPAPAQSYWHALERGRGALVWVAGEDFPATIEGFTAHYRASGLALR